MMRVPGAAATRPRGKLRWICSLAGPHYLHLCPGLFRSRHTFLPKCAGRSVLQLAPALPLIGSLLTLQPPCWRASAGPGVLHGWLQRWPRAGHVRRGLLRAAVGYRARHLQGELSRIASARLPPPLPPAACRLPCTLLGSWKLLCWRATKYSVLIVLLPTASTRLQGPLQGHKVPIRWAAFSEDGRQLVTASPDRTVLLWDVPSLSLIRTVPGGLRLGFGGHPPDVLACAWVQRAAPALQPQPHLAESLRHPARLPSPVRCLQWRAAAACAALPSVLTCRALCCASGTPRSRWWTCRCAIDCWIPCNWRLAN